MYVGMDVVRKSAFLCDVSMAKLFVLFRGLKRVTVRSRTHSYNVRGYGCCTEICVSVWRFYDKIVLDREFKIMTVRWTSAPIQRTWVWVTYGNLRFCVTFLYTQNSNLATQLTTLCRSVASFLYRHSQPFCALIANTLLFCGREYVIRTYGYEYFIYANIKKLATGLHHVARLEFCV